jgi:hypothetical protein
MSEANKQVLRRVYDEVFNLDARCAASVVDAPGFYTSRRGMCTRDGDLRRPHGPRRRLALHAT